MDYSGTALKYGLIDTDIGGGIRKELRLITDLQQRVAKVKEEYIIAVPGFDVQPCYYCSSANLYGAMYNWLQKYHPDITF